MTIQGYGWLTTAIPSHPRRSRTPTPTHYLIRLHLNIGRHRESKKTRIAIGLQRVQVFSVAEKNFHNHQKLSP
ncbi:hypothetical protein BDZ89DRAFT_1065986 [Hymenopellis radicata]|nr:hypothetical protein BDZ89DRAFT_1065986 [Hymenopellis radicata]